MIDNRYRVVSDPKLVMHLRRPWWARLLNWVVRSLVSVD